jgi:hypothetical protein
MQDSLSKCFLRFCRTNNVAMIPLVMSAICLAIANLPSWRVAVGIAVGVLAYRLLERTFHVQMHTVPHTPFYASHHNHHDNPTPENGVPGLWVMAVYGVISLAVWWAGLPWLAGVWLGVVLMLAWYEWFHFLCHCNYSPKTKYGWQVRVNHNLHHVHDDGAYYEMLFPKRRTKWSEKSE